MTDQNPNPAGAPGSARPKHLWAPAEDGDGEVRLELEWPDAPPAHAGLSESPPIGWMLWVPGYGTGPQWGFHPWLRCRFARLGWVVATVSLSGTSAAPDGVTTGRSQGDLERFGRNHYLRELADLRLARSLLLRMPGLAELPAVVCGHSRGGGMALVHGAEIQGATQGMGRENGSAYRAVVAWAAIDSILRFRPERLELWRRQGWLEVRHPILREGVRLAGTVLEAAEGARDRLDILGACTRLRCPVLAVHAGADRAVPEASLRNIAEAAGERGRFLAVDGADHVFGARHPLADPPPTHLCAAVDATTAFLAGLC